MNRLKLWQQVQWRAEPVPVARGLDDLWLGVKGQTNAVIAGFLWNSFKWSRLVFKRYKKGKALFEERGVEAYSTQENSEFFYIGRRVRP